MNIINQFFIEINTKTNNIIIMYNLQIKILIAYFNPGYMRDHQTSELIMLDFIVTTTIDRMT